MSWDNQNKLKQIIFSVFFRNENGNYHVYALSKLKFYQLSANEMQKKVKTHVIIRMM